MTERLIIRLASEASQKQHWLIWSESGKEIIASGEIDNAQQLNSLTEKALSRHVICLLPGVDVCIKELPINGAFNRQMQQALPYLLEEDLAGDVEKLHFTVIEQKNDLVHVAVCDKQRMSQWLSWLAEANINCKQFIPEGLALPLPSDDKWQAVQLDNDWIIRENQALAWSSDVAMLVPLLEAKIDTEKHQVIESYSPVLKEYPGEWVSATPTLPMELLAVGALTCKVNLLQHEFKIKKEVNKNLLKWRLPAILAVLFFIISCINVYIDNQRIETEIKVVKEQAERVYQLAFPNQRKLSYSRIKKQLRTMLAEANDKGDSTGFLVMLDDLGPTFNSNQQLSLTSLKYDVRNQEMRLLAVADNFQAFEKFSTAIPQQYSIQQGALNSSKNQVSGLLTIRKK